jgi:Na+-driven multidrug efflux pump
MLSVGITAVIAVILVVFAVPTVGLFSRDSSVIEYGVLFLRANTFFLLFNCVNHTLAGALRGRGDSRGPMFIMLLSFVLIRQIYLFVVTRFVANTPFLVGFGYPVGWMCCCAIEVTYYFVRWGRRARQQSA